MLVPAMHFGLGMISFGLGVTQIIDPTVASTIAAAIQQQEGYFPGSLAYQNNNPGNLIFVGQTGASPGAGGFAKFPDYATGLQALINQIQIYAGQGLTIAGMMQIYAPGPTDNPTLYAQNIATALGVDPSTPLTMISSAQGGTYVASGNPSTDEAPSWLDSLLGTTGDSVSLAGFDLPVSYLVLGGVGALLLLVVAYNYS